ncbi:MarR family transcriptional regulator [Nocardioides agariphilus]|jgi:DNA-binding MarR family transcriptional regulator|uniref:MarR family transcriptional regulator n=1 Tax=Nocardioides agariphilus TaxID=433664 RepID=A0A930VIN4_9ACTN|nr:MarR family transcriptional regulator [Nocardioides agariphilus]MBF4767403.1 MarR family transcriptional regulator [Nocardioides agariphilus]
MHQPETTGDLLMGTARRLRREFGTALVHDGVTPAQARALRSVMEAGALRPSALAEHLDIAARSATEVVDALEEQGLVERRPDPDDRRATLVTPTRAAKTELAQVDRLRRAQTERFLAVLSDADRAELDRILRILVDQ